MQLVDKEVKIILHGSLKKYSAEPITVWGNCAAEAINGVTKIVPAFKKKPGQEGLLIEVVGYDDKDKLTKPFQSEGEEVLHIVPAMAGGKGGFFRVVLGAVLIAASFYAPFAATAAFGSTTWGSILFSMGASLALGGLLEMISPQPKMDRGTGENDPEASKYLGASQNTVKIGTRIPIMYGEVKAFGHYISFDIDAKDVVVA